jgi:hydroxymethylpyrimidine pyrophosphatase-like HAD family hydrolase
MGQIAGRIGPAGTAICANGAMEWDLETMRVVAEYPLPADVAGEVVDRLRSRLPELRFAMEYHHHFGYQPGYELGGYDSRSRQGMEMPLADLVAGRGVKLLARHPRLPADELTAGAIEIVGDIATPVNTNRRRLVEITAPGVDKASALARLCARDGIAPAQVVAFGDMPNDLPMLTWAGTSYAVANAHPQVLAAVARRAPSNDQDGVAAVLAELCESGGLREQP